MILSPIFKIHESQSQSMSLLFSCASMFSRYSDENLVVDSLRVVGSQAIKLIYCRSVAPAVLLISPIRSYD
jgi:hypothetical protein